MNLRCVSASKRLVVATALVFGALASTACGGSADTGDDSNADTNADALTDVEQPETNDALAKVAWQPVSGGVTAKAYGGGANVVVVCGGYQGPLTAVQKWTDQLVREKLGAEGFGQIISIIGPGLGTTVSPSAVAKKIASVGTNAQSIVVIGHSSGEATAATIIAALGSQSGGAALQAKTTAFALDGWEASKPARFPRSTAPITSPRRANTPAARARS